MKNKIKAYAILTHLGNLDDDWTGRYDIFKTKEEAQNFKEYMNRQFECSNYKIISVTIN